MKLVLNFNLNSYPRATIASLLALLVYSLSNPFPKAIGAPELLIGGLLLYSFFKPFIDILSFKIMSKSFLFYGVLYIPLIGTLYHQNSIDNIIRDMIPLFYLLIPIFVSSYRFDVSIFYIRNVALVSAFVGLVFSLRELSDWAALGTLAIGVMRQTEEYLIQSPLVLFASVYFLTQAVRGVETNMPKSLMYFAIGLIPVLGFYFVVLRAPLILSLLIPLIYTLIIYRRNYIIISIACFLIVFLILDNSVDFGKIFELFITKNEVYGTNNKLAEVITVWTLIIEDGDVFTALLGKGFGGTWLSPAVGVEVRYAHSLLAYSILKTGLLGLSMFILFMVYMVIKGCSWFVTLRSEPEVLAVYMSTWPTLFVNIFLESGYKTFGFGIVLAIFFSCGLYSRGTSERSTTL